MGGAYGRNGGEEVEGKVERWKVKRVGRGEGKHCNCSMEATFHPLTVINDRVEPL